MSSARAERLTPSATIEVSNRVNELRSQGVDILSLSVGEPDYITPAPIRAAAKAALDAGHTGYTHSRGILPLREMISADIKVRNGIDTRAEDLIVTPTKMGVFMTIQCLVDPQDEVLVPEPVWGTYADIVRFCGGTPVPVLPDGDLRIDLEDLKAKASPRTRLVILNSPCNPTGIVQPKEVLKGVTDIAEDVGAWVLSDEVYERIIYAGEHHSPQSWSERVITVNGFSKAYAMTGWRLGWVSGPKEITAKLNQLQQASLTCCPSFAQYAALAAPEAEPYIEEMLAEYRERRELVCSALASMAGVDLVWPQGAFYAFPRFSIGKDSKTIANELLEEHRVATTPGIAFGTSGEDHLRLSFAASREVLTEALERIGRYVADSKPA